MYIAYSFEDVASEENPTLLYLGTSRAKMMDAIGAAIKKDTKIQKILRFDNPIGIKHPLNVASAKAHTPEEIAAFRSRAVSSPVSAQDKSKADAEAKKKSDQYEADRKAHIAKVKAEADAKAKPVELKKAA
jgi:hypothetical protein